MSLPFSLASLNPQLLKWVVICYCCITDFSTWQVSEAVTAAARQCAAELEGPGPPTKYEPIFGNTCRQVRLTRIFCFAYWTSIQSVETPSRNQSVPDLWRFGYHINGWFMDPDPDNFLKMPAKVFFCQIFCLLLLKVHLLYISLQT